ncbi:MULTISPECIES: ABC transporter substrate-binding protein [unclassified Leeuwenhoekiella]|uniref:ABC transporter substrate-binding protein n=1 Tax=unclassified Leeuwenhoekiella TaxID=2615029 RepID=UPI000C3FBBBD|nr:MULTISPECIES: ABC transporter substrate-binding protein [unclassified Leeuwenhoekiella]MAW96106.1 myristoyl transferase [Leeuwenhoekiella sp.]MBA80100.1 myristoyl transferase [Leeuwenhoekiella sp.]
MKHLKIALDWTANTNHMGFFIARELGYYKERNLEVSLMTPAEDDYEVTPAKKVELGIADFALCPLESIISYQTKEKPFNLKAIAAIYQEDLSAIAVKEDSGIKCPADLDGKSYASYKARYEDKIVEELIKNDGGEANLEITYPDKLGIWETLLKDKADATWIFLNWEAYQAEAQGIKMRYFKLKDYNIPYSYSPVIAVNGNTVEKHRETYSDFLQATKAGFFYAEDYPKEAAEILRKYIPENEKKLDLVASINYSVAYLGAKENWGRLNPVLIGRFVKWLDDHQLETETLKTYDLIYKILD